MINNFKALNCKNESLNFDRTSSNIYFLPYFDKHPSVTNQNMYAEKTKDKHGLVVHNTIYITYEKKKRKKKRTRTAYELGEGSLWCWGETCKTMVQNFGFIFIIK